MDHPYNQQDMDFDMASGFDDQYAPVNPYLQNVFAPSTPKHSDEASAPHYDFQNPGPSGYDTFMSAVMPHDAHYVQEEQTEYPPEFWRTLVDFEIPDFTKTSIANIPDIQALNAAYLNTYGPLSTSSNATRMQYAKSLAFALLTHYHPASQGYTVAPTSPGPVAKNGMNFILAADDKSDIWKDLRKTNAKANRRRAPTKKELERAEKAEQAAKWDYIPPQDIAAFVVMRETMTTDSTTGVVTYQQHPHTYLAIMIDNFTEFPRFSTENTVHRSDILTDALCRGGKIQNGHGMLLYGPSLEFYAFDRGNEWVYYEDEDEDEEEAQDIEPKMEVLTSGGNDLEMDLRSVGLDMVDAAFQDVAVRQVVYMAEGEVAAAENAGSAGGDEDMEGEY